jgi:hypothetical protein
MGPISVVHFQIRMILCIFYAFLDTLPMIVFSSCDSILIKSYKIICRPSLPYKLRVLLQRAIKTFAQCYGPAQIARIYLA